MEKSDSKNVKAVAIGFGAILIATAVFFAKIHWEKKEQAAYDSSQASSASAQSSIDMAKIGRIEPDDLRNEIFNGKSLVIIDLRSADDFRSAHIAGSKNVPADQFASYIPSLDSGKSYVIIDSQGDPAVISPIAEALAENGNTNVSYLDGGFSLWDDGVNPVVNDGNPASFSDQSKVSYVNADDLKKWMETDANLLLVDVRSGQEFAADHLKGAVNVPLDDLENRRHDFPLGRKTVVYDADSLSAFKAAVRLYDMGILNVYSLAEGLNVWRQKGYETVH